MMIDLPHIWTRSSWLNCSLRGDEAVYWVSIGQQSLVLGGTEPVRRYRLISDNTGSASGLYAFIYWEKVEILSGVTDLSLTDKGR